MNKNIDRRKYKEAQARAQKNYDSKFTKIQYRCLPEYKEMVDKHATTMGETTTDFVKRAIAEAIERDNSINE